MRDISQKHTYTYIIGYILLKYNRIKKVFYKLISHFKTYK